MRAHVVGLAVLGGGVNVREWDNHQTYQPYEVVYWANRFWRSRRVVEPPWIPAFMDGEVPGRSDAWYEVTYEQAYRDSVNGEVFGLVDIQNAQRNMNALKPVNLEIARILLKSGQRYIDEAIRMARAENLPGETARDNVMWKLRWHADTIGKLTGDPVATMYTPGEDLKKWVMQAYIELNASETGASDKQRMWDAMWSEIQEALARIPREVLKTAAAAAGGIIEGVTGVPTWVWILGGVAVAGGIGFVAYKVSTGPVGGAVARRVLR
jgi:hypothetical protein